jgi:hypothetical protein
VVEKEQTEDVRDEVDLDGKCAEFVDIWDKNAEDRIRQTCFIGICDISGLSRSELGEYSDETFHPHFPLTCQAFFKLEPITTIQPY